MGMFPTSGSLGYYCIAISLFVGYLYRIDKSLSGKKFYFNIVIILFLCIATGSRGTVVQSGLILFGAVFDKRNINLKNKLIFGSIAMILISFILLSFIEERAGRGDVMISGGGRIEAFNNIFYNINLKELIIGHGLGQGTNTLVQFSQSNIIVDTLFSTFIYEFGLPFTLVITCSFINELRIIIHKYYASFFVRCATISIFLVFVTGIPTDQSGFCTIAITIYALMKQMYSSKQDIINSEK
jgi:hypothetical protein